MNGLIFHGQNLVVFGALKNLDHPLHLVGALEININVGLDNLDDGKAVPRVRGDDDKIIDLNRMVQRLELGPLGLFGILVGRRDGANVLVNKKNAGGIIHGLSPVVLLR